jgi:hypothetical protein
MASKGSKRTAACRVGGTTGVKKPKLEEVKVDPQFADIIATLQTATEVPERCCEMLVTMVAPCLSTPKASRHAVQTLGISMIEQTLHATKAKLLQAVEQEQERITELKASEASYMEHLKLAEAEFASKMSAEETKQVASDEAGKAVKDAEDQLANAKDVVRNTEEPLANLRAEKAMFEKLLEEHFKAPMQADAPLSFDAFEPHVQKLGLDESLSIALPSSCAKSKEQRGGFDAVVLAELEKALFAKIESLGKADEIEAPKIIECKAAVLAQETSLQSKIGFAKVAAEELEAAKVVREESAEALSKAKEVVTAAAPNMQAAATRHEELVLELRNFEEGPLATFEAFRDTTDDIIHVDEEAATAGA